MTTAGYSLPCDLCTVHAYASTRSSRSRRFEGDVALVETHDHSAFFRIDAHDEADVAVEDVLVVVVAQLHHLVADPVGPGAAHERRAAGD